MRWRLAWLSAVLWCGCVLGAQTSIPVTAIWDLDPSHDAPGLTWELERDGVIHPCGPVTVTATDRRCAATVPALAGTYRLRGVTASGEAGPWSGPGSGTQTAPGQFVITWHSDITLTPPEPTEMAVAYVSSASQTADLTSAGGNVDATLDAGTGSNRVVYAYVVWRFDRGTLTGVAYNGVSLTAVGSTANSGNFRGALYRLVGPTTGSNTLRASFTGSGNFPVWVTCISLDGVDSTTPEDTLVQEVESGSDTSTSQSVSTSSATDDRVLTGAWFATSGFDTTGSVVGSSYTIRQQVLHGGAGARLIIGDADGAATVTPETSYNNTSSWGALRWAVNVNAAAGSGAYSLALDAASVAVSGQAIGLQAARRLAVDATSVSVTGQAMGVYAGRRLAADAGSVSLTGQAVGLRAARTLALEAGSLALSEQAVSLRAARRVALDAATVTVAGQAVTLTRGLRLSLDPASLTISGQTVGLSAARRLTLDAAAITISGSDVTLIPPAGAYSLALDPAAVSLSGQPLTLRAARTLALEASSVAVTGQAVGLSTARTLALDPAAVMVTGQDVALLRPHTLALDAGSVALTGQALTLRADRRLPLDAVVMTVTGGALVFDYSGSLIGIIDLAGAYTPVITLAGAHTPVIAVPGAYTPTVTLAGVLEA